MGGALGTRLVKLELASIEFDKPKDNISTGECQALKEFSRNKSIILKKSDKGNTTVLMSRQDKLNEGQVLLNGLNNYRPLDKPVVETTTKNVSQKAILIKSPGGGGTKGISGWGCAARTLEPLTYTGASSAIFCYPILE